MAMISKALARMAATKMPIRNGMVRTSACFSNAVNPIGMTLDCHTGDSTMPLQPLHFDASQKPLPEFNHLKDLLDANDITSVVISWPLLENEKTVRNFPGSVLKTLDGALSESHDTVTTTRPFYMLDGGGRRVGSMCLVRPPTLERMYNRDTNDCEYQLPGAWLKDYSRLQSLSLL
jgi:hypothetical protein